MGMDNTTCRKCGKKFHACSSCGLLYDWEHKYCSATCYEQSEEFLQIMSSIKYYVDKYGAEIFYAILNLLDDSDLSIPDLFFVVGQIEKKKNDDK